MDCGFHTFRQDRFRVKGINTPETHAKERRWEGKPGEDTRLLAKKAAEATDRLVMGSTHWPLIVTTYKDTDSFGRWLAEVSIEQADGSFLDLGNELIRLGLAQVYKP